MSARTPSYRTELPKYNTALGVTETLAVTPPFSFYGVTARVFPLRARMNSLRNFCDRYLNVAREVCEFRPALPYVFLVVLDYGRMAIEELNLGWISQNEIFFGVPLSMWRPDRLGRPELQKWVLNTPFIVVDDARSLSGGRESYGWPKVLGSLRTSPERWLIDPRSPTRFLSLDIQGADSEVPGTRLLDIEQQSGQNAALVPPELGMLDPFGLLSRLTRTSMAIGYDLAQLLLAAPLSGFAPPDWNDQRRGRRGALLDSFRKLPAFLAEPGLDVVTLKQFRDARDPAQICYQSLVESRLKVSRYNRGGLLGSYNILQGDITGGFRIRLQESSAFPVIESFGLEVAEAQTFRTPTARRQTISFVEPFFPFWMSVDLSYGKGRTLCWRTHTKPWHVKGTRVGRSPRKKAYYNTLAGGAEQVWHGPFGLPAASFEIYPLKANLEPLEKLVKEYLDFSHVDKKFDFILEKLCENDDHAYVYMLVSANRMFSKARSGAHLKSSEIGFYVPIRMKPKEISGPYTVCLATPFAFVDNPVLATTMREVQGVPAMDASIETPSRFLRREEPLLKVQVDVFEALGAGLPSQRKTLIEIKPWAKRSEPSRTEAHRDLLVGISGRLMLKQFRDTERPDRACYQSLVYESWHMEKAARLEQLADAKQVLVYRYPSLPLGDTLGLIRSETLFPQEPGGAIIDVLETDDPFRIETSFNIGLPTEVTDYQALVDWHWSQSLAFAIASPARKH
ncbi:MAG TPA: hypothetical protein VGP73_20265 [Thermoanaerobaculia bacterium]